MSLEHFTEEQLQQFAIADKLSQDVTTHLRTCAACREQLEIYRYLFNEIAHQPVAEFNFNVTAAVMQKLPQPRAKRIKISIASVMFFMGTGMCAIVGWSFADQFSLLFKNMSWLIPVFILVSLVTAATALIYDMLTRYHKKLNLINSIK
jgi:hypothetical protein